MSDKPLLSRLDLNLLVALDALLTEKSVTRAADRLRLSQPALSASLARIRTHFNDPVLARKGNSYELTPLAIRLADHTATALEAARRVFESEASWIPAESTREFAIYGSDYAFAKIGTLVAQRAALEAPGVRFRFMLHNSTIVEDASNRLRSADAMLIPHGVLMDLPSMELWRDHWVVLASESNEALGDSLEIEDFARFPWILTYQGRTNTSSNAVTTRLAQVGVSLNIVSVVDSFLALPAFIVGTDRLALVQAGLADTARRAGGVRVLELPFDEMPLLNALWWHHVHDNDPGHIWLRGLFEECSRSLRVCEDLAVA